MPTDQLANCWAELVGLIKDEFLHGNQDPINFIPDEARLKLRAELTFGTDSPEWYVQTLSRQQVLTGDLRLLAAQFYRDYRKELDGRRGR
jgi:hypothetical protein